jgi:hypothetical protein
MPPASDQCKPQVRGDGATSFTQETPQPGPRMVPVHNRQPVRYSVPTPAIRQGLLTGGASTEEGGITCKLFPTPGNTRSTDSSPIAHPTTTEKTTRGAHQDDRNCTASQGEMRGCGPKQPNVSNGLTT